MSFFTVDEIEYFSQVAGRTYRTGIPEDKNMGLMIRSSVVDKTVQWAEALKYNLETFTVNFNRVWTQPGRDNGQVAKIKPYTWAKVYKQADADKGIFFTIGVDAGRKSLLIKIHYQEQARKLEKALLSDSQKQLCERLIKTEKFTDYIYCREIGLGEVEQFSKERLVNETLKFISEYESTYDLIIRLVWPVNNTYEPEEIVTPFLFIPGAGPSHRPDNKSGYIREKRLIQPARIHEQVSQLLYRRLIDEHGKDNVSREHLLPNNTSVDVVLQKGTSLTFYEIKVYPSVRECIREALGQLLEYSYWPIGQKSGELIVVSPHPIDAEARSYINNLRAILNLPIWYQQFDLSRNALGSKV